MKYLCIENSGLILPDDFSLMGTSTKVGNNNKIGQYGSGLCYAIGGLMRPPHKLPVVYSGKEQITLEAKTIDYRDAPVKVLEDKSQIYIYMNDEIDMFLKNYNHYFAFDRKEDYTDEKGNRFFLKKFKSPMVIYRKGIRCYENTYADESLVDIDFADIYINESRVADIHQIYSRIKDVVSNADVSDKVMIKLLQQGKIDKSLIPAVSSVSDEFFESIKRISQFTNIITKEIDPNITGLEGDSDIVLPTSYYLEFQKRGFVENKFEIIQGAPSDFTKSKNIDQDKMKEIKFYLNHFMENKGIKIHVGKWSSSVYDTIHSNEHNCFFIKKHMFNNRDTPTIASKLLRNRSQEYYYNILEKNYKEAVLAQDFNEQPVDDSLPF